VVELVVDKLVVMTFGGWNGGGRARDKWGKKTWGRKVVLFNFFTPFSSASGYEIHLYLYRGWKRDTLSLAVPNLNLWFHPKRS
jgi:hypothetical protein